MSDRDVYAFTGGLPDFEMDCSDRFIAALHDLASVSMKETLPPYTKIEYALPAWVRPPENRAIPSHAGILALIREAKDAGHIWADCALAELAIYTGIPYVFRRIATFNRERYEIEVAE